MLTAMIIDDEIWVVESLKRSKIWDRSGFTVIGEANNGLEAYEKIKLLKPDLVFVDIRMPEMNGLELIMKVNELSLGTLFIVVSGYAEFAYAQKAMSYGALGYCLKPFEPAELTALLEKAIPVISRYRESLSLELFNLLEKNGKEDEILLNEVLVKMGFNIAKGSVYRTAVSIGNGMLEFGNECISAGIKLGSGKRGYIYQYRDASQAIAAELIEVADGIHGVGMGMPVSKVRDIFTEMENAEIKAYQFFLSGKKGIYGSSKTENYDMHSDLGSFDECLKSGDRVDISKAFDTLKCLLEEDRFNILHAYHIYNMTMAYLYGKSSIFGDTFLMGYDQLPGMFTTAGDMISKLKDLFIDSICNIERDMDSGMEHSTVKNVLKYVAGNFFSNISIQSVAQKFFINPNYLCHIFKKDTGETFTEYVTRLRMEYACKLLKKKDLPVSEVSEKAGYDNYFYFSRLFKKTMGVTPTQFRDLQD